MALELIFIDLPGFQARLICGLYQRHCLKRPSAQRQPTYTLLRSGPHFHPPL
jgi:hypothetical protein